MDKPNRRRVATAVCGEQSLELQAAALQAAANAIVITDREGIIVWVNAAFQTLSGYSSEEAIGQNMRLLKSGRHTKAFYKSMWDTILSGRTWQGRVIDRRKDGSLYEENMTIAPVRNSHGHITHFIAVKQDSTDQTLAEERASTLFQAIQNSSDMIAISDREGVFTFVNDALLRMTKRKAEEVIGKHFGALFSPDNPLDVVQGISTKGLESGGWRGDCLLRRGDKTDFPVFLNVGPVKDEEGRVTGMFGISRDMSEPKQKEEALRASEEQFRQLADNIREVFFVVTPNPTRVAYLSPAYEEIWGRPRQEVYERPAAWIESVHPDEREAVGIFFARLMQGIQSEMSYRIVRTDGSMRWIYARTFPVHDPQGKFMRVVGLAEDVTTRQQAENNLREAHEKLNAALEELKQQAREAAKLTELVDILQSCQTVDEAYKIIETALQSTLGAASGSGALFMTAASRDILEAVATWGETLGTEKTFRPDDCWALRRGKIHTVRDPSSPLRCAHVNSSFANGYVCVPLAAYGETMGLLFMTVAASPAGVSGGSRPDALEAVARQATAVAERISLALGNLRLREVLRSQSIRDPLTGLYNRRFMEESLERELRRAVRGKQQLALLMMDIDRFKNFNDTFGHLAGDALLRGLGNLLKLRTRGQDVACRYGGEEFAFILSGASLETARKRAEILREDIKNLNVQHGGTLLGAVTLSIGIAAFPDNGESTDALLKAADDALYRAKEEGRDRIALARTPNLRETGSEGAGGEDAQPKAKT